MINETNLSRLRSALDSAWRIQVDDSLPDDLAKHSRESLDYINDLSPGDHAILVALWKKVGGTWTRATLADEIRRNGYLRFL